MLPIPYMKSSPALGSPEEIKTTFSRKVCLANEVTIFLHLFYLFNTKKNISAIDY